MVRAWRRMLTPMPLLASLAGTGCADQTLLCRRPEVLQEVDRVIRQRNIYNTIDEASPREAPTSQADAVVCEAAMDTVAYNLTPNGWEPRPFQAPLRYDVQVRGDRFFYVEVAP